MIQPRTIERAVDLIVAHHDPLQVYVVGSYSVGTATDASDLDLLVVTQTDVPRRRREHEAALLLSSLLIPVDVKVYTPDEFHEERADRLSFASAVTELQGKLVYSRELGGLEELSRRWGREPSGVRHARLEHAPGEWQLYQAHYARAARQWREPPWAFAAARLRAHPDWRVADFGCGEGHLSRAIPNPVISLDHVAAADGFVACDLARVPLAPHGLDAVVLSLALIGANWPDYVREGARVLRPAGRMYVTERDVAPVLAILDDMSLRVVDTGRRGSFSDLELVRC